MQTTYKQEALRRADPSNRTKHPGSRPAGEIEKAAEPRKKLVEFSLHMPNAQSVAVAGTFNDWDLNLMLRHGANWKTRLSLAPGRYEYRFVVDGRWIVDPNARESTPNDFGSTNSVLLV